MKYKKIFLFALSLLTMQGIFAGQPTKELPQFTLGGALRFNYNYSDWKEDHTGGAFGYDVLLLHLHGSYKKFLFDADYRFYVKDFGGPMLKYGWFGYQFNEKSQLQLGLTRVPFGIQPVGSNNFLFNINYYVGLEDDSDMGIKYVYEGNHWDFAAAFFKNADEMLFDPKAETSGDRYGYDVGGRNKGINQFNGQLFYKWGDNVRQKIGASAEFGQLYNLDTKGKGTHFAFAVHHELFWKGFSVKTQISTYAMYPKNKAGESRDTIMMTAYGAPYAVAAKANTYTLGVAYTIPLNWGPVKSIQFYNDFGWLQKWDKKQKDSFENVAGCMIAAGPIYTYIDYAMGKHHAWLGPDWGAFAYGNGSNSWHARLNINFGYYF